MSLYGSLAPEFVIRVGKKGSRATAQAQGEPALVVGTTSIYDWVYDDKGSGADNDVTVWRPHPSDSNYYIIGDYAQGNYGAPTGTAYVVKAVNDDPNNPLLKAPKTYNQIWTDRGSGGDSDGSIWYPVPEDNYVAIGFVAQLGYDMPSPKYACLRKDLVELTDVGALIWKDKGSGAHDDVAFYKIVGVPNAFVAQANYDPYSGNAYKIKGT